MLRSGKWNVALVKAEFLMPDGTETEAYFDMKGSWVRTEFDFKGSLPEAVMSYIVSNYPDYKVDDANYVQTPLGDYYELELEKNGRRCLFEHLRGCYALEIEIGQRIERKHLVCLYVNL